MPKVPSIPFPSGWKRVLNSAVLAAAALHRVALITVRAGFEEGPDPRAALLAEVDRLRERLSVREEELRILSARLALVAPRSRPHYPPKERFAILLLKAKTGWSTTETARRFLVTAATIAGWTKRVDERGEGALVEPRTPVNRHPDRVALIVQETYAAAPGGGRRKIADLLARAGLVLAASTVERLAKRQLPRSPRSPRSPTETDTADAATSSMKADEKKPTTTCKDGSPRVVKSKYAHHLWHVDITTIATADGMSLPWWSFALSLVWPFSWHIAVVLDHFSRSIVAFDVFGKEPTARQICRLLDRAVRAAGRAPKHMVTDRGSQFASEYQDWCNTNDVKPRWGAIGQHGSIAVIERFFRSLKDEHLHRIIVPFARRRLLRGLDAYQRWYNEHRPHQTLGGRTPRERLEGRDAERRTPRFQLRARFPIEEDAERCDELKLVVRHIDGEKHLPVFEILNAA